MKINENSFSVAFYSARKKLGIASGNGRGGKRVVKKRLPSAPAARPTVDLATLQAAAKFLDEVGNADVAIVAHGLVIAEPAERWSLVEDKLHPPIEQALVVCHNGANRSGGAAFADFVASDEGRAILRRHGFDR